MKKIKIALLILILAVVIIQSMPVISMARHDEGGAYGGGIDPGQGEINPYEYKGEATTDEAGELVRITSNILATIRHIGTILAVVVLTVIGFKYMVGSLEQKANYKENMSIYLIGCAVLMAATTIPSIMYEIMN